MYKLVILDYDGTLVGKSGIPTPRVEDAILKTVKKGVKVSISTGRSAYSLLPLIKKWHLDLPHVFLAGALVYNPIKDLVLLETPLAKSAVITVDEFAKKHNLYLEVSTKKMLYYNIAIQQFIDRRKRISHEPCELTDISKLVESEKLLNMRFILSESINNIDFQKLKEELSESVNFQIGYPHNEQIEVVNMTSLEVSKVSALRHLLQYFNISPKETIAIGDSPIDLPIIEHAGMGIAMGNAKDDVKKYANWIAPSVDDDGVAVALEKFVL